MLSEFHTALGQFLNYRTALAGFEPQRILYLAVPIDTYSTFFALRFTQTVIETHGVYLLIYEPQREEVVAWIP